MINLFKLNDIEIKKFLIVVLSVQAAIWGLIGLQAIGLDIPFIRQAVGLVYLSFIPGILILRVLKLHELSTAKTLCYTIGLSIASVTFVGLSVNLLGLAFGFSHPLTITPLAIALTILVLTLCALSYKRDSGFSASSFIAMKDILAPPTLFFLLIVLLSILGAFLVTFYHSNVLLLLLMVLIASVVAFVSFNKFIPTKWYPMAVFMISLALIYHKSLISSYLSSSDVLLENYFCQLTLLNMCWDPSAAHAYSTMLSDTTLPATYSLFLNLDSAWIFKAIYPIFFSLVPLTLYQAYHKQVGSRVAFLAAFLVMIPAGFSGLGAFLAKMLIAELFFALLLLLMVDKKMNSVKRATLAIVFATSLIVSHYGLTYTYMIFYLFLPLPIVYGLYVLRRERRRKLLPLALFAVLFLVMATAWGTYAGAGSIFEILTGAGKTMVGGVTTAGEAIFGGGVTPIAPTVPTVAESGPLTPFGIEMATQKLLGLVPMASWEHRIIWLLYWITGFFIMVSAIRCLIATVKRERLSLELEFIAVALGSLMSLLACVAIPYFSINTMGVWRFYQLSLFCLAPLCILGAEASFSFIARLFKLASETRTVFMMALVPIVLMSFFLFENGFVYEVTGCAEPSSVPLSMERMKQSDHLQTKVGYELSHMDEQDVLSARWLAQVRDPNMGVYSGRIPRTHVLPGYGMIFPAKQLYFPPQIKGDAYIYLSRMNVVDDLLLAPNWAALAEEAPGIFAYETSELLPYLGDKIYTNGGSAIYMNRDRMR